MLDLLQRQIRRGEEEEKQLQEKQEKLQEIRTGLEGIRRRMEPEDLSGNFDILPDNLYEAIEAFRHDFFVQGILGEDFCREYCKAKKKEWQEYASHVTEWEISRYLYRI